MREEEPRTDHQKRNQDGGSRSPPDDPFRPDREPDDHRSRTAVHGLTRLDALDHVGFGLVHELVGEALQPIRERHHPLELERAPLGDPSAPDHVDHPGHDVDELIVVVSNTAEQLRLVARDELHAVEIVPELIELAECRLERAFVRTQKGRRHAVELGGGIVLDLAVGGDLPLEDHEPLRAAIDCAQRPEADRADDDEEHDHGEEGREELGVDRRRDPPDRSAEPGRPHCFDPSRRSARMSPNSSSGSKRVPRYWTRRMPR